MFGVLKAENTIASLLQDIVDYIVEGACCLPNTSPPSFDAIHVAPCTGGIANFLFIFKGSLFCS